MIDEPAAGKELGLTPDVRLAVVSDFLGCLGEIYILRDFPATIWRTLPLWISLDAVERFTPSSLAILVWLCPSLTIKAMRTRSESGRCLNLGLDM